MVRRPVAANEMFLRQSGPPRSWRCGLDPHQPPDRRPDEQFAANHTANGISGQAEYVRPAVAGRVLPPLGTIACPCRAFQKAEPYGLPRFHSHLMEYLPDPRIGEDGRYQVEVTCRDSSR